MITEMEKKFKHMEKKYEKALNKLNHELNKLKKVNEHENCDGTTICMSMSSNDK